MSDLPLRLTAHAHHRAFPAVLAGLRGLVPGFDVVEPDWLALVRATAHDDLPPVRAPRVVAELRVAADDPHAHLPRLLAEVARSPAWLVEVNGTGWGHDRGDLPLPLTAGQFSALLPHVLTQEVDVPRARTWPDPSRAALRSVWGEGKGEDDPYELVVEVERGSGVVRDLGGEPARTSWDAVRAALPPGRFLTARVVDAAFPLVLDDVPPDAVVVLSAVDEQRVRALPPGTPSRVRVVEHQRRERRVRVALAHRAAGQAPGSGPVGTQ